MTARIRIGTSGWAYPDWRGGFYAGVAQRRWLAHAAARFSGIEVNATFYRFVKKETFAKWRDETPPGFAFAIKGHRLITHLRRLRDVEAPLADMRNAAQPLKGKLEVVLWQLPANLHQDLGRLAGFAKSLKAWPGVRHAFEFRHESWFDDATAAVLDDAGLANCLSDSPAWPLWDRVTGGLAYVRLHGHRVLYASRYGPRGLAPWARRVRRWSKAGVAAHVYFDNTADGHAPDDALRLLAMLGGGANERRRRKAG